MAQYTVNDNDAAMIHRIVKDQASALKNWIASAVENGNAERALELVKELRQVQDIAAKFNVIARADIAAAKNA